jgi:hypothetical protein
VVLGEWELQAEYFEDDFLSGVSPVLFANDPQASEAAIRANPEIAKKDLDRLNRCFFVPESVELDAALKIVKKARLGDVDYVFKRKNLDRLFEPVSFNRGKTFKIIQRKINTGSTGLFLQLVQARVRWPHHPAQYPREFSQVKKTN